MHRHLWVTLRRWQTGLLLLWVLAAGAQAQVTVGDNLNMSMNGFLGFGYSGNYGAADGVSGHGIYGSGDGNLTGFYYNPNFLSFNVRPFYNRNQDNGSFASVLRDTGLDASTSLFGGTHFPGSISYSKAFSNGTQYGIPGGVGLIADSATQNFSVTWSEFLPDLPSLTATFADNSSSSTIQGETGSTDSSARTFNLISNYKIDGWGLTGFLNHQNFAVTLPAFLSATNSRSESSATSYGVSANHSLPLSGAFVANYNRTDYGTETGNFRTSGSTDTADALAAFHPTQKFSINGEVRYIGNLIGALQQSFLPGGTPPLAVGGEKSQGVSLNTYGTYNLGHGFMLVGYGGRQMQTFAGVDYTTNRVGGTLTYSYAQPLFGVLYLSFGMVNNATNNSGGSLGFVGNVTLKKRLSEWELQTDFSYAQNVQTIIAAYTTSNYSYGGLVRRRFGANMYWTASYRGLQSGLTQFAGYGNRSDTFMTNFTRGRYGMSGSYSKSHGTALLNSTGVFTPTPLVPVLTPDQVLYNGKSYGVGAFVSPLRRMVITVNWYKVRSDTLTASLASANNSDRLYGQMQYNLRKLSFRAGYWRVFQSITGNGFRPVTDNTYFFNISRWFDLF
ncbi:MAG TPA: hypothetical protein VF011_09455 [Terriglobales bacterium]